ncbi:hypothetical protein COT75_01425 [Candidatus Beckwithbacteria bacterium CG10_big_fil_rev_8_21_14_0_10_34_10]|uniref:Iron hydrogenase large subunit C-terminal domain-containing protein n=1 Tax=Candidatus Beckwithbacteria bacterium CG10_big_fil_rev_8_21_14_0_10_34_10 TaxID=1974495 RepID=A0A2H0W9V5_9BACT|nr:MAG: hypothetical protein COT75_01425 [Candidatus Beckwithbacteria bacterium CG10_big_fil_rev_8_21_14_0_10_34_10]
MAAWLILLKNIMTDSPELSLLLDLLGKKEKLAAMLAPSFPIDFPFPDVIGKLKRAGFSYAVEVSRGAVETNKQVVQELKSDPLKRIIASPCPSLVRYIKAQRPELLPFLSQADSPMTASAKLVRQKFPGARPVFIGPCLVKKLEAKDYPDLNILAITFKELFVLFERLKIDGSTEDFVTNFDLLTAHTRLYPISGGLCQSAGIKELLTDEEFRVVSGLDQFEPVLDEFVKNKSIRLVDVLFCPGGCVGGPGIKSTDSLEQRRQRVVKFWVTYQSASKDNHNLQAV